MAARRKRLRGGDSAFSWVLTGLSGLGLIVGGFGAGVLLGVVTEEPTVLTGHWAGRSERVALRPAAMEVPSRTSTRVPSDAVKRIEPEAVPAAQGGLAGQALWRPVPALHGVDSPPVSDGTPSQVGGLAQGSCRAAEVCDRIEGGVYPAQVRPELLEALVLSGDGVPHGDQSSSGVRADMSGSVLCP